jgi:two-component system nitrate/nitrite response regulator NarL
MTKVLLADDHPLVLSGIETVLRETRFKVVTTVDNGNAVLEALPQVEPEILIMDLRMPGRSGLDVLRTLRQRGDSRLIVILTAHVNDRDLVEALQLGVNGLLLERLSPGTPADLSRAALPGTTLDRQGSA